jgi:predicted DCC family thiol-disulfide oxidoreductase YuxK
MTITQKKPDRDTVLYDGQCRFCRGQIGMLRWLDWWRRLQFTSLHDPSVVEDFPELPMARLHEEMVVVDQGGRARGGAEAVRYLSRRLPPLWPLAALLHIPCSLPLWRWLYAFVAKRRLLIAGRCDDGSCRIS